LGHQVSLLLFSYGDAPSAHVMQHGMDWYSESLHPWKAGWGGAQYLARAKALIEADPPDWIIGFSDTWYGILAQYLGAKYGIRTLIDAYDNYESYLPRVKPLHWAWRHACRHATAITAAGPNLLELISDGRNGARASVVPMAADPIFQPMDRNRCRAKLGLPPDAALVGYCGSLHRSRGIDTLFESAIRLRDLAPGARLVLSGRRQGGVTLPPALKESVIELGYLPDKQMPTLLNAMDVLLAINVPSSFGHYSYPAKLYEAMQCRIPVMATEVAGVKWILRNHPECLVPSGDAARLARQVNEALTWKHKEYSRLQSWHESALLLDKLLRQ
jgi:glycosyltransferase involved in cell wall biosynthesis